MDIIKIKNLEVFSNHGVLKEENVLGQKFLISADIYLDTRKAGTTDDINDSVNYSEICHLVKNIMEKNTFKLIETAAEKLAKAILLEYSLINKIVLEVKKPWAPILLPLEYVSVTVERKWHKVFLSLGSNMGDREKYLNDAIEFIKADKSCRNVKVSSFIETEPYGNTDQDSFINCCVSLETLYSPHELNEVTSQAEQNADRKRLKSGQYRSVRSGWTGNCSCFKTHCRCSDEEGDPRMFGRNHRYGTARRQRIYKPAYR